MFFNYQRDMLSGPGNVSPMSQRSIHAAKYTIEGDRAFSRIAKQIWSTSSGLPELGDLEK